MISAAMPSRSWSAMRALPSQPPRCRSSTRHSPFLMSRGFLAGRSHDAERHRRGHAVDHEHVAAVGITHHPRRAVAERRIDAVDVAVRRLGDVRVGRDQPRRQRVALCYRGGLFNGCQDRIRHCHRTALL